MMYFVSINSRLKDVHYTATYKYLLAFLFYTSSFISIHNVHNVIAPIILSVGCRPLRLLIQNISIFGLKLYRNLYHYRNCFKRHSVGKISSQLQDPCVMYCPQRTYRCQIQTELDGGIRDQHWIILLGTIRTYLLRYWRATMSI